jgi:hypothetical protein
MELDLIAKLPLDIRLHIARYLDADMKISIGYYNKLIIPNALKERLEAIPKVNRVNNLYSNLSLGNKYTIYHVQIPKEVQTLQPNGSYILYYVCHYDSRHYVSEVYTSRDDASALYYNISRIDE